MAKRRFKHDGGNVFQREMEHSNPAVAERIDRDYDDSVNRSRGGGTRKRRNDARTRIIERTTGYRIAVNIRRATVFANRRRAVVDDLWFGCVTRLTLWLADGVPV